MSAPAIEKLFKTIERTENLDKFYSVTNLKKIQASSNTAFLVFKGTKSSKLLGL